MRNGGVDGNRLVGTKYGCQDPTDKHQPRHREGWLVLEQH
jgi:hypothetical protein